MTNPLYLDAFIVSGLGAAWLIERAVRSRAMAQPSSITSSTGRISLPRRRQVWALAVAVALSALIVGQATQSLLFTSSLAAGQFDARAIGYGYPLGAVEHADAALQAAQRQSSARAVYVMEPLSQAEPLNYLLVRERPDRVGLIDSCLVLPPPDAGPTLIVATNTASASERLLAQLPNTARMSDIPMLGNQPLAVYRVAGALGSLSGETAVGPITFADAAGARLRLDAIARATNGDLRLRWTVLAPPPADPANPLSRRLLTRSLRADGSSGRVLGFRDCEPTRWRGGETVFTWLPAPASWTASSDQAQNDPVVIQVQESTATLATATVGPIGILADTVERTPWSPLVPSSSPLSSPASGGVVRPFGFVISAGTIAAQR